MVTTLGKYNNQGEIPVIAKAVSQTVQRLRALSPL
jgi:hypothetical protein